MAKKRYCKFCGNLINSDLGGKKVDKKKKKKKEKTFEEKLASLPQ